MLLNYLGAWFETRRTSRLWEEDYGLVWKVMQGELWERIACFVLNAINAAFEFIIKNFAA